MEMGATVTVVCRPLAAYSSTRGGALAVPGGASSPDGGGVS